jgi:hypothetical protein
LWLFGERSRKKPERSGNKPEPSGKEPGRSGKKPRFPEKKARRFENRTRIVKKKARRFQLDTPLPWNSSSRPPAVSRTPHGSGFDREHRPPGLILRRCYLSQARVITCAPARSAASLCFQQAMKSYGVMVEPAKIIYPAIVPHAPRLDILRGHNSANMCTSAAHCRARVASNNCA